MTPKKKVTTIDDIIELTEAEYFKTLYDSNKFDIAEIKTKEFEEYRAHGLCIKFL